MRLYDRLFLEPNPDDVEEGKSFKDYTQPGFDGSGDGGAASSRAWRDDPAGTRYQFERLGYFISDSEDSRAGAAGV